jgi:hypothetical protein
MAKGWIVPVVLSGAAAEAGPTTLISDTFTDTDATALASHTIAPTNTPATSWSALGGSFTIQSNLASNTTPSGGVTDAVVDAGDADVTITAIVRRSGAADCGIIARATDVNNYLLLDLLLAGTVKLYRKEAGSYNELASVAQTFSVDTDYTLKFVVSGTALTGYVDDVEKVTATSSFNQTEDKHGIWVAGGGNTAGINDFIVLSA